jgi:hypothetical protein
MRIDRQVICHACNQESSEADASAVLKAAGYKFMTPRRTREWFTCIEAFDWMSRDDRKTFVRAWEASSCVTEVWLRLRRAERPWYTRLTPRLTLEWGRCLRATGIPLKRMPRTDLPPSRTD